MRVLQVITSMNTGGMQTSIMNNYEKLANEGVIFDFLTFDLKDQFFEEDIRRLGGKIFKVTSRRENFIKNKRELKKFFSDNIGKYSAIEFHQGITYYLPLKLAYKYGYKNKIIHNHGIDRFFLKRYKWINEIYLKKRICSYGDKFVSCNMSLNNHLFTNRLINENKIKFIPNSIDVDKYLFDFDVRKKMRKKMNLNKNDILLGHVGLFVEVKNHKFLLEVFKKICLKDSRYKLLLIGEGPLRQDIEQFTKDNFLEDNVIFTGNVSDVESYLCAMDIFVFPSIFEGFPLSLIEAQASGLSVVCSSTIDEIVDITNNCIFLDLSNDIEWIKHITMTEFKDALYNRNKNGNLVKNTVFNTSINIKNLFDIYKK